MKYICIRGSVRSEYREESWHFFQTFLLIMRLAFRAVDISFIKLYFPQKYLIYCPVFYEHKGFYLFFVSNVMPLFMNNVYI
jgi:hypothetical protein